MIGRGFAWTAAIIWVTTLIYLGWFYEHAPRVRTSSEQLPYAIKGHVQWLTPQEVRRVTVVQWVGMGVPFLIIGIGSLFPRQPEDGNRR